MSEKFKYFPSKLWVKGILVSFGAPCKLLNLPEHHGPMRMQVFTCSAGSHSLTHHVQPQLQRLEYPYVGLSDPSQSYKSKQSKVARENQHNIPMADYIGEKKKGIIISLEKQ